MSDPCPACELVALRRLGPLSLPPTERNPEGDIEMDLELVYSSAYADGMTNDGVVLGPRPRIGKLCQRHSAQVGCLVAARGEKVKSV